MLLPGHIQVLARDDVPELPDRRVTSTPSPPELCSTDRGTARRRLWTTPRRLTVTGRGHDLTAHHDEMRTWIHTEELVPVGTCDPIL